MTRAIALLCLIAFAALPGCGFLNPASSQTFIDADQVRGSGAPVSVAEATPEGHMRAAFHGAAPTTMNQDADGTYVNMQGPVGVITADPNTGTLYVISPKDTIIRGIKITPKPSPGEPFFTADSIEANLSPVVSVYQRQFTDAVDAIKDMTKTEATKQIESMKAAGTITAEIADVLLQTIVPHLPAQ